jgi:hypothetical protein
MRDEDKTKEQLIDELVKLRRRVAELEASERKQKTEKGGSGVKIGEILMEMGYLTRLQLERSLRKQEAKVISHMLNSKHQRLGEIMLESGIITEEQLTNGLAEQGRRLGNRE